MNEYDSQEDTDIHQLCNEIIEAESQAAALDMKCLALRKAGDDLAALCADAVKGVIITSPQREMLKEALEVWEKEVKTIQQED